MRFEKKFVLALAAGQQGSCPRMLRIGFKTKIRELNIVKKKDLFWKRGYRN